MKNIKNITILVLLVFLTSCQDDFIDLEPQDAYTEAIYFKTPEHFNYAANQLYQNLIGWGRVRGAGLPSAFNTGYAEWMNFGTDLTALAQDVGRGTNIVSNTDLYWSNHYYFLLDANTIIEKGAEYDGDQTEIASYVATGHFFRAYHHYELLLRFGGIPIVTSRLELNDESLISGRRNSRYEVVVQILSDLDVAIANLPSELSIGSNDKGKVSSEGAKALKARVLLYEATWDTYVGTSTDGDGVTEGAGSAKPANYPSINAMLDEAITLSNAVMVSEAYELWNHNTELDNMSSYHLFNLEDGGSNPAGLDKSSNTEFIIQGIYDFTLRQSGTNISHTVAGRLNPSRKMMDMFLCTDGLPIDKSPLFQGFNTISDQMQNRDYRMNAYFGELVPAGGSPALTGQTDINSGVGLNCRKHRAYNYGVYRQDNQESMNFPYLRLAEVYLIYAEALIERDGSISNTDLNKSLNIVRARAGVAPLTNELASANNLNIKEEIRRERAIELFGENSRFDDLKRWGIAEDVLGATLYGPVIEGTVYESDPSLYDPSTFPNGVEKVTNGAGISLSTLILDPAAERPYTKKNYLMSIPIDEIIIATDLLQNPGW